MCVVCVCAFQDVSAEVSLACPDLYQAGPRQRLFNPVTAGATLLHAVYSSLVLFFLPSGVFHDSALDYQTLAVTVSMAAVFCATFEVRATGSGRVSSGACLLL